MTHDKARELHLKLMAYHEEQAKFAATPSARAHHVDMARKLGNAASIMDDKINEACT